MGTVLLLWKQENRPFDYLTNKGCSSFAYIKTPQVGKLLKNWWWFMMKNKILKSLIKKFNTEPQFKEKSNAEEIDLKEQDISSHYDKNIEIFKSIYSVPKNMDVKVREFTI